MQKSFLLTLVLLLSVFYEGNAQNRISYAYDDAGNRITRTIVLQKNTKTMMAGDNLESEIDKENIFEEEFQERTIKIYPNPTRGNLGVEIQGVPFDSKGEMLLYHLSGKLLMKKELQMNSITPVDMNALPPATYLLILLLDNEKLTYKVAKL